MRPSPRFSAAVLVVVVAILGCNVISGPLTTADPSTDTSSTTAVTPETIPDAVDS